LDATAPVSRSNGNGATLRKHVHVDQVDNPASQALLWDALRRSASSSRPARSGQRPELGERYLQLGEALGPKEGVVRERIGDDEAALTEHEALERACRRVHDPVLGRADLGVPAQLRNPVITAARLGNDLDGEVGMAVCEPLLREPPGVLGSEVLEVI